MSNFGSTGFGGAPGKVAAGKKKKKMPKQMPKKSAYSKKGK